MLFTVRQVGSSDETLDVRAGDRDAPGPRTRETGHPRTARNDLGRTVAALLLVCLVGGLIAGFYLEIYRSGNVRTPAGYDTARYLGQAAMVAHGGLASVATVHLPPPGPPHTSRVAFPVLDLSLARLLGTTVVLSGVVILAARWTSGTNHLSLFVGFGCVALVTLLVTLLESFAYVRVAVIAAVASVVTEVTVSESGFVSAQHVPGAALIAGATVGILIALPPLVRLLSRPGRVLATSLWIK